MRTVRPEIDFPSPRRSPLAAEAPRAPARRDRQGPPRPSRLRSARRPQARLPRPRRVCPVEKSRTGCPGAAGGQSSAQAQGGRVLVANQVSEWPFGWPLVRKGRNTKNRRSDCRARRPFTDSQSTSARNCPAPFYCLPAHDCAAKNIAPERVSAHRQPFSLGLTTSAVRCSARRPPGCFRCGERKMNPC